MKTKTNALRGCVNLPSEWWDKISSILTNGCIIFYSDTDCQSTTQSSPQLFSSIYSKSKDMYLSYPSKIPNHSFYGTK